MTFPDPYRTIIVEPIEIPDEDPKRQPGPPTEDPSEPEPAESPQPQREREPAKGKLKAKS